MLNNNEHQKSPCALDEQLAAYLYNEIGDSEKPAFESHLRGCKACAGELTDFSALRSSIAEWRETDFESLPTPTVALPVAARKNSEKPSWLETIRVYFTSSPIWAGAGAVLLLCAGLFWFASSLSRENEIAGNRKANAQNAVVAPQDKNDVNDKTIAAASNEGDSRVVQDKSARSQSIKIKDAAEKTDNAPRKISARANPALNKSNKAFAPNIENANRLKSPAKNDIPSLAIEDEDDDSLRLSDIFDEVGIINTNEVEK